MTLLRPALALCFALVLVCGILYWTLEEGLSIYPLSKIASLPVRCSGRTNFTASSSQSDTKKRAGDGCFHVFLDVGANVGVHGRFLFEPKQYPQAKVATAIFDNEFGQSRDNRNFCAFEIEPNPNHFMKLNKTAYAYKAMGWRYEVMNVAAGDKDGYMNFKHKHDEDREEWGFSVLNGNKDAADEQIPTIRLAAWILEHINKRQVPSSSHGTYDSHGP